MGLFKKKTLEPAPIGQAMVLLDNDGWAYVDQQHHPNMDPDAIAMLAPITFVIVEATRLQHRGPQYVAGWLATARQHGQDGPDAVNATHNPSGVTPLQDPVAGVPGATGCWGSFAITPASLLTGTWNPLDGYSSDRHRERILGALMAVAQWRDVDQSLPGAFDLLTQPQVRYDHPATLTDLPQMALDYGVQQGALADLQRSNPWGNEPLRESDDPPF